MELIKTQHRIRCELGACKNPAAYTLKLERVGIGSRLHVCEECLKQLYKCVGETIIPKSLETAKKRRKGKSEEGDE